MAEDDQVTTIDILAMEVEQKLPYWLEPQVRFAGKHEAQRRRNRQRWLDARREQRDARAKAAGQRVRTQRMEMARARAETLLKFDPDQPRDESGKWTSGGGGGAGQTPSPRPLIAPGARPIPPKPKPPPRLITGNRPQPKIRVGRNVSHFGVNRVTKAMSGVPDRHAEALQRVEVKLNRSTRTIGRGVNTIGYFNGSTDPPQISLGERHAYKFKGEAKRIELPLEELEKTVVHEMGHALDHQNDWKYGKELEADVAVAVGRMTEEQRTNATYWLGLSDRNIDGVDTQARSEAFAELYALAYNPAKFVPNVYPPQQQLYFGGLKREEAEQIFAEALAKVKTKHFVSVVVKAAGVERRDDRLLNGWLVTSDGAVYVITNGSPYRVDVTGTPFEKLPPGEYTDEEAEAAVEEKAYSNLTDPPPETKRKSAQVVRRQQMEIARARAAQTLAPALGDVRLANALLARTAEKFDPDQPRDESGKWTSGGGSGDGGQLPLSPSTESSAKVQIGEASKVSDKFRSEIRAGADKLPDTVRNKLNEAGVKFATGTVVSDIVPGLKGVTPRGWPAGMTWDNAEGMYHVDTKTVVMSEFKKRGLDLVETPRAMGGFLHETGHAYDHALGWASQGESFKRVYDKDVASMTGQAVPPRLLYYLQSGSAGRQEAFAEVFAHQIGEKGGDPDIRPHFPNVSRWVKNVINAGRFPR